MGLASDYPLGGRWGKRWLGRGGGRFQCTKTYRKMARNIPVARISSG